MIDTTIPEGAAGDIWAHAIVEMIQIFGELGKIAISDGTIIVTVPQLDVLSKRSLEKTFNIKSVFPAGNSGNIILHLEVII